MGVSVAGVCYPTQTEANDAFYSGQPVQIAPQDATHVVIVYNIKQSSVWSRYIDSYNIGGYSDASNSQPLGNVGTPCTYANDPTSQTADGIAIGWMVVTAMVMAYGVHLLRRGLT